MFIAPMKEANMPEALIEATCLSFSTGFLTALIWRDYY
jgi:hypothetical protein